MSVRIAAIALGAVLLAGCASAPLERTGAPQAPAVFKEAGARTDAASPAAPQPQGDWWKVFADPVLDELVRRAAARHTDIAVASARLAQARALARTAGADLLPQLGARAGVARQGGPLINAAGGGGTLITAAADLSYEVDLVGRLADGARAARLDAASREALLRGTQLLVQGEVARSYLELRALDAERALLRASVAAYRDAADLTARRHALGSVAELDVVRARTELATVESEALVLDRRRAELEHALAVLVGEVASGFALPEAPWDAALPVIPPGVPSLVLTRRPDVSAAQRTFEAAQARLGAANKAWFPTLPLTASAGFASSDLGELLKMGSRFWLASAVLSLPVFDGGRREAARDSASAELDAAFAGYRERILVAFREVEDQLAALRILAQQAQVQERAATAAGRATLLAESRYRAGLASQLEVLDARRSELRLRRDALQARSGQYQATVGLVRALGGGWGAAGSETSAAAAGTGATALR